MVSAGSESQRARDNASVERSCNAACTSPARVGRTITGVAAPSTFTLPAEIVSGSTSANGVPAYPPSDSDARPPSTINPPPRTLTKSASMRSWSVVKNDASMLPKMMAR